MKSVGGFAWCGWMNEEERKRRYIRSLELQIVDKERELARLREALVEAQGR